MTELGYDPDTALPEVVTAFQRRYCWARVDGALDAETMGLIRALGE